MEHPMILVVDDDPLMRKMVRVTLQSEGYAVSEAGNGRAALEVVAGHRPNLVIQDLVLPDIDGLELARRIRALPGCADLPILALSGLLSKMTQARGPETDFADCIAKPVEPSRLVGIVGHHLGRRVPRQEGPGRGRRVLVVDDDPLQRKLLKIHLERACFKVATAEDGLEALEDARRSPPDAIVSDVLMPRLDGLKLCLALRQDPHLSHIPVLLTSAALIEEADRRLAEGVGASAFVARTPDYQPVLAALLSALDAEARPAAPAALPDKEYADQMARQLELQAELSAGLTRRLAWAESRLSILSGFTEALKRSTATEPLLDEILYRALEATGADRGAAYLMTPDGSLPLRTSLGYHAGGEARLPNFFGHPEVLRQVLAEGAPLQVPSAQLPPAEAHDLLRRAAVRTMLLVPLVSGEEPLGVLAVAWTREEREEDWRSLAVAVCGQVSQAVALGRALVRLEESRWAAEASRLAAEESRWAAEDARAEAEQARIAAERARAEAEEAQARLTFLSRASLLLAQSLEFETLLSNIAQLAVAGLADWCSVDVVREDGALHRLAIAHADPARAERMAEWCRRHLDSPEAPHGVPRVVRTGVYEFYPEITAAMLDGADVDPELRDVLREVSPRSAMIVPMVARGRTMGAITLVLAESDKRYDGEDLALAEELARRCALALDNARLYQEAQRAVRARDEFLSIAAHELKTPITSLRGFAQAALRQMATKGSLEPDRTRHVLEVMDRQSSKLAHLVFQLLDVSRLESGRLVLDRKPVDLVLLVGEVLAAARARTNRDNLVLRAPAPVRAVVDPLRMEQVMSNLVDNAIKYSPEGGPIEVAVLAREGEGVRLEVRDRGPGVPADLHQRVFEVFYQSHAGHSGGMGLGLYVCRRLVDLHGGHIWVESPEDGGARFIVSLPSGPDPGGRG